MSVWHEIQLEFAWDTADELLEKCGATPELTQMKQTLGEAFVIATGLPEDDTEESIQRLTKSNTLLTQTAKQLNKATSKLPAGNEKLLRRLHSKISQAKAANETTIVEFQS